MTIEDVLRKRGTIILQLKSELAYIAGEWGLIVETVEIRNVRVLSDQLFKQMQAPFRDRMRLESEASALETEKSLAEKRFTQKEQIALQEWISTAANWNAGVRRSVSRSRQKPRFKPPSSTISAS